MAQFQVRYNPSDFRHALLLALRQYSYDLRDNYKQKLIDNNIEATGTLIQTALPYSGEISPDNYVAGIRLQDYWIYIENGRTPGSKFPPKQAILDWMNIKRILPTPYILPSGKRIIPTLEQVAFLIARKIARDGIPAKPYLQEAISEMENELERIVNDIVGDAITEITLDIGIVRI